MGIESDANVRKSPSSCGDGHRAWRKAPSPETRISDRTARRTWFIFSSRRADAIARRATDRDTPSREDSSAVNARAQAACCSWTRVEARLLDAREPSGGVSRRGSVRFYLSFPPSARAARGPVVATAREARGRVARLGQRAEAGGPAGRRRDGDMGAVCGTPNAASADAEVNVADAARRARLLPRSETGDKTVVALGKFDAMHRGHRELARAAAKMGAPYLVSFGGMAEVLGWTPKLAVVAETDRARVLATWADPCAAFSPGEVVVPFADVRRMPPRRSWLLKDTLGVSGIVAGSDYRFGFKAAGTARRSEPSASMGLDVTIVDLLPSGEDGADEHLESAACELDEKDATAQVSSTRVRACLAAGDVEQAARLLGRPHRLVLDVRERRRGFEDAPRRLRDGDVSPVRRAKPVPSGRDVRRRASERRRRRCDEQTFGSRDRAGHGDGRFGDRAARRRPRGVRRRRRPRVQGAEMKAIGSVSCPDIRNPRQEKRETRVGR